MWILLPIVQKTIIINYFVDNDSCFTEMDVTDISKFDIGLGIKLGRPCSLEIINLAYVQCFSLPANRRTVLFSLTYQ
jgi:hypothetical protein